MRVKKYNSSKDVLLKTKKYSINWDKDGNSSLERKFRDLIYPFWKNQIVLFQCTIPGTQMKLDFLNCNKRICVEINGEQHDKFNKFFHNNSKNVWLASMQRDTQKREWLELNNIKLLELVKEDLDNFSPENIKEKFGITII